VSVPPTRIPIALIAAVARNGVIGIGGAMPWRLSSDIKRFRRLTMGKPVIMGRKTYESIGKPLDGRVNIVVTRSGDFSTPGVEVTRTMESALARGTDIAGSTGAEEVMVIGGGEIYAAVMPRADRLYITHVDTHPEGDTYFPFIDPVEWRATLTEQYPAGEHDSAAATFVVYERKAAKSRAG
jgi:dihydrofolate reductase